MRALDQLVGSYLDLCWHFDPAAASAAGSVSADGRLARFDAEAVRTHVAAFRATTAAIEELEIDDLADEIDRTALLDHVRATIARLEEDRPHIRDPGFWLTHLIDGIAALLPHPADQRSAQDRTRAFQERVDAIPPFLDSARRVLHQPPVLLVDGALVLLAPLGELLVQTLSLLADGAPSGAEDLSVSVAVALEALARFGHWLREDVEPEPAIEKAVLGATRFERRLNHRYAIRSGSAELWRYAAQLMAETERSLAAEAQAFGAGDDWREAVAEQDAGRTDALASVTAEIERARAFLTDGGFPDVPAAGPAPATAPAALAPLLPLLTYLPGSARLLVALGGIRNAALTPLVAGAALPGRHLQEMAARAAGSEVRRRLRTPIAVDGWALYAEALMDELGFAASPETRLVVLARRLRAGAGLAADVGLHARGMTPAEAIALLVDRAALDRSAAEALLRRIIGHPTDAAAGALGCREILELRAAAGMRGGDAEDLARFHRSLLAFGALPPDLAGWGMGLER